MMDAKLPLRNLDRRFITLLALLAAWGGIHVIGFQKPWKHCQQVREAIAPLMKETDAYQELIGRFPAPERELETLNQRVDELKKLSLGAEAIPKVIQQLALLAGQTGITLVSVEPGADASVQTAGLPEGVGRRQVEVRINCTVQGLAEFLDRMGKLSNPASVDGMNIRQNRQDPSGMLQVELLLGIYGLV